MNVPRDCCLPSSKCLLSSKCLSSSKRGDGAPAIGGTLEEEGPPEARTKDMPRTWEYMGELRAI